MSNLLSPSSSCWENGPATFSQWQPAYAAMNIPTFPVRIVGSDKIPMTKDYGHTGLRGSAELAKRFDKAEALGTMLGRRYMLADVDSKSESALADVLTAHGNTPVIARTASKGGFHAWYRDTPSAWKNYPKLRTRRAIRPQPDRPIDYLAGGFAILPPSLAPSGRRYEFVLGGIEDLDNLPAFNGVVPALQPCQLETGEELSRDLGSMRDGDGRNKALFDILRRIANSVLRSGGTRGQLEDLARQHNGELAEPMEEGEIMKIAQSVWAMTLEGRNYAGQHGAWLPYEDIAGLIGFDNHALILLNWLKANEGRGAVFWITNTLAPRLGLTRKELSRAREALVVAGYIMRVRRPWRGHPAIYRWA